VLGVLVEHQFLAEKTGALLALSFLGGFGSISWPVTAALSPTVNFMYKRGFLVFGWSTVQ